MSDEAQAERGEPRLVRKLRDQKDRHRERNRIYRGVFVLAGFTLLLGGLAMLVLPGPAFVVIPIGLAILALEFTWAENLLEKALEQADAAKRKAEQTSRRQRVLSGIAGVAAAGAALAVVLIYDIPYLPV